jgi:dipeptidyl aminopeptidase/acylaminoacyl peptidase
MRNFLSLMVRAVILGILATNGGAIAATPTPPPLEAYGRLPAMQMVSLSPSGERYAFIAGNGVERGIIILSIDNKVLDVIKIGTVKVRTIGWAGEDHVLVYASNLIDLSELSTVPNRELTAVLVHDLRSHKGFEVFGGERYRHRIADVIQGAYGNIEIDGHWYGFFGGLTYHALPRDLEARKSYDLYRVDLDTGDAKIVEYGIAGIDDWLINQNGQVVAHTLYNSANGTWSVVEDTKGLTLASGQNDFRVASLHFGKTPDVLLVSVPRENENDLIEEIPLNGGPSQKYEKNTNFLFDRTGLWIGNTTRTEPPEYTMFSSELQAKLNGTKKAFPNHLIHLESASEGFNRMIVRTEGDDDSGTYWLVDIPNRSADPIGSAYPEVRAENIGPVRMVEWKASDGLLLHGVLTLPPGRDGKALPLVVLPHGGPEAHDKVHFDWWAQAFASHGYAVFQPNFRGSDGSGFALRNAGLGQWGRKMQTDISDGVDMLAQKGIIDPKRACIVGGSYGGYAALAGVTVQNGLYRCAVAVAGVADVSDMLAYERKIHGTDNSYTLRYWNAFVGVTSSWGSDADPISPAKLASRADAPILLIHGKDDSVVPFEQSETMERALKRAGKPVEFVVLPNEDHWLSRENTRITMLKSAVSFVEKYNPPD